MRLPFSRRSRVANVAALSVTVQSESFDAGKLQHDLLGAEAAEGAVAAFTGYVRVSNDNRTVDTIFIEHYPGMTERSIIATLEEAAERWPVLAAGVVHRIGDLAPGDPIVWVGVSSAHRDAAFSACEFIMDYLKTRAPFWKKESGPDGESWVSARDTDTARARRWAGGHQA